MKFNSLVDLFEKSCQTYASRDLFGTKQGGQWSWVSYAEVKRRVDQARAGLAQLGVGRGDKVALISNNRVEWAVLAYATYGLGAAFVPMYEAQQPDEWAFIVNDCAASVLFGSNRGIFDKINGFPEKIASLKGVFCLEGGADDPTSYAHVLEQGSKAPVPPVMPDAKDLAGLIYTSGTTGHPKGVLLSHGNFASNVSAVHAIFPMEAGDRSLSFLPWAHSFGQTCELHCLLSMGASIALNTAVENLVAEMSEVQPTLLFSVPRIFNRLYDVINKGVAARPKPIQALFHGAMAVAAAQREGKPVGALDKVKLAIADKLIFSKARARLGGRLKYAFSGGAALSKNVAEFIDGLGIVVYEGYGLTETSPIATANSPGGRKIGSVGKAIPDVKIVIDKSVTGDEKNGEIVVYGPNIMQGYHNRPDENAQVLMADGGFRTGDMGQLDGDGFLWITGRIKEQYKLENGKYVVPSPLEEQLKLSPFITNVMIYGDNKPYNVALVVPDKESVTAWAKDNGIGGSYDEMLANERVKARVGEDLEKFSHEFRAFDKVKKFALIADDFTVQNDMLTPSLKLKRRNVLKKWGDLVAGLYKLPVGIVNRVTTIELFKEEMKFSAGHFTIFSATLRENLHGHNFSVYVSLEGEVDDNGMLSDYRAYKRWIIDRCAAWNETFLLPENSPHLRVEREPDGGVVCRFADETFRFLARDVTLLPASNTTLEELSRLFGEGLCADPERLARDKIHRVTVKCASGPGQWACWSWSRHVAP